MSITAIAQRELSRRYAARRDSSPSQASELVHVRQFYLLLTKMTRGERRFQADLLIAAMRSNA